VLLAGCPAATAKDIDMSNKTAIAAIKGSFHCIWCSIGKTFRNLPGDTIRFWNFIALNRSRSCFRMSARCAAISAVKQVEYEGHDRTPRCIIPATTSLAIQEVIWIASLSFVMLVPLVQLSS